MGPEDPSDSEVRLSFWPGWMGFGNLLAVDVI